MTEYKRFCATVNSLRQNHGAPGAEQGGPPAEEGGDCQPGQLLQSPDPGAEGQGAEGPVQLRSPR